jgi:hypothetical protein
MLETMGLGTFRLDLHVILLLDVIGGAPRLYSRGPSNIFGETRRSMSSFAKASARRP